MNQWVVFGFGNYLSDILDAILANKGKVKTIVNNIQPSQEQWNDLKQRIAYLRYNIPIIELNKFQTQNNEKYCCGFINGRHKLIPTLKKNYNINLSNLIHPTAYLCSNVSISEGVTIGPLSVIGPNSKIGKFSIINRTASIGHDVTLEEYSTISPSASIGGGVKIGRKTMIGIGATIINDLTIGKNSIIGAGSTVINNVPDNVIVVGTPAKFLRKNE